MGRGRHRGGHRHHIAVLPHMEGTRSRETLHHRAHVHRTRAAGRCLVLEAAGPAGEQRVVPFRRRALGPRGRRLERRHGFELEDPQAHGGFGDDTVAGGPERGEGRRDLLRTVQARQRVVEGPDRLGQERHGLRRQSREAQVPGRRAPGATTDLTGLLHRGEEDGILVVVVALPETAGQTQQQVVFRLRFQQPGLGPRQKGRGGLVFDDPHTAPLALRGRTPLRAGA